MKRMIVFWGLTFVLFTTFVFGAELERYSGESNDDGQETNTGFVNTSFQYIELMLVMSPPRTYAAYRFPNVTIPQGATINSAYLSLQSYGAPFLNPIDSIGCENVDSATVLESGIETYDISDRWANVTTALVSWDEDNVGQQPTPRDSTPDLKTLVQEIVDRLGWKSGNAIMFLFKNLIIDSDTCQYETCSWDANPDSSYYGGILFVDYTPGGAVPNDTPVVSDIPNQTILEGDSFGSINLDDYVTDSEDHDSVMIWSHWGEVELLVNITDRVASVTVPDSEWNGSETIWFKACDPGGLCDSNEATFTVTAVNDPPIVSDIPDSSIAEGDSFGSINLDDYVTDPDDHDSVMIWSHRGEVELLVDITDRVATVTVPDSEWNGSETIWFKVCDPGGLCDSNEASFTVVGTESADEDSLLLGSADFFLNQNYPNPFNLKTNITYSLATGGKIKLTIYDLLGKRVKTLVDQYQSQGCKSFDWNGTNDRGNGVASGIYFYRLEAEQFTETKKLLLLK